MGPVEYLLKRVEDRMNDEIICVGEILWDSLPSGLFLGGAPYNVAHDLRALGCAVRVISRVGRDFLGEEAIRRVEKGGIPTELIQIDDTHQTGFVEVVVDEKGEPSYRICEPVAWDSIEANEAALRAVRKAEMIVFGTLACRGEVSRRAVYGLADEATLNVLDVNLRTGFDSKDIVEHLLDKADIVKVNASELGVIGRWFGLPSRDEDAAAVLGKKFSLRIVAVSFGASGGGLWHDGRWTRHPGFKAEVVNSVGAGDAFLAGLLTTFTRGGRDEEMIENANLLGAYAVTQPGGTPEISPGLLDAFRRRVSVI